MSMKKIIVLFLSLVMMSGCTNAAQQERLKFESYKALYTDVLNAKDLKTSSFFFYIEYSVTDLGNQTYRYDVIIDRPQVAMYDVEILLIHDDGSLVISETMMPSVGIFEDKTYYMIPNQINKPANYVQGFALNGISNMRPIHLKMVVSWKDASTKQIKEYFDFTLE